MGMRCQQSTLVKYLSITNRKGICSWRLSVGIKMSLGSMAFPGGSDVKESARNSGDLGSVSGSGRSPGEGNGNPLQYSCLENSMDRGAWRAPWGHKELDTSERLTLSFSFTFMVHLHSTHTQYSRVVLESYRLEFESQIYAFVQVTINLCLLSLICKRKKIRPPNLFTHLKDICCVTTI